METPTIDRGLLVFDASPLGHRENYVRKFAKLLGAEALIGDPSRHFWQLLTVKRLLLPTFETRPRGYTLLALVRAILCKQTALLILRPHVQPGQWAKLWAHRLLVMLPNVKLGTIFPIDASSHLSSHATLILDLEYWDQQGEPAPVPTPLSDRVRAAANGRKTIIALGFFSPDKGGDMLMKLAENPRLAEKFLIVVAGCAQPADAEKLAVASAHNVFAETRELSDAELKSMYLVADFAWCCYAPERDISSGIFGRAMQYGVPAIVREGSLLQHQATNVSEHIAVPWDDIDDTAERLEAMKVQNCSCGKTKFAPHWDGKSELRKLRAMLGLTGDRPIA